MRTKTIPPRSISDRGLIAEMIPIGKAMKQPEDRAAEHERGGHGRRGEDDVVDVTTVDERLAERLVERRAA